MKNANNCFYPTMPIRIGVDMLPGLSLKNVGKNDFFNNSFASTAQNDGRISSMPDEVLGHTTLFLKPKDLTSLSCTSRLFHKIADDNYAWEQHLPQNLKKNILPGQAKIYFQRFFNIAMATRDPFLNNYQLAVLMHPIVQLYIIKGNLTIQDVILTTRLCLDPKKQSNKAQLDPDYGDPAIPAGGSEKAWEPNKGAEDPVFSLLDLSSKHLVPLKLFSLAGIASDDQVNVNNLVVQEYIAANRLTEKNAIAAANFYFNYSLRTPIVQNLNDPILQDHIANGRLTAKQVIHLNYEQVEILQNPLVQSHISANKLTAIEAASRANIYLKSSLKSKIIRDHIVKDRLTVKQAIALNRYQLEVLEHPIVQDHISNGHLTATDAIAAATSYSINFLNNPIVQDHIANNCLTAKQAIALNSHQLEALTDIALFFPN